MRITDTLELAYKVNVSTICTHLIPSHSTLVLRTRLNTATQDWPLAPFSLFRPSIQTHFCPITVNGPQFPKNKYYGSLKHVLNYWAVRKVTMHWLFWRPNSMPTAITVGTQKSNSPNLLSNCFSLYYSTCVYISNLSRVLPIKRSGASVLLAHK